jgi:hypothetical protein
MRMRSAPPVVAEVLMCDGHVAAQTCRRVLDTPNGRLPSRSRAGNKAMTGLAIDQGHGRSNQSAILPLTLALPQPASS